MNHAKLLSEAFEALEKYISCCCSAPIYEHDGEKICSKCHGVCESTFTKESYPCQGCGKELGTEWEKYCVVCQLNSKP